MSPQQLKQLQWLYENTKARNRDEFWDNRLWENTYNLSEHNAYRFSRLKMLNYDILKEIQEW